jgi:Fe2+ transport system protein FeoA
MIALTELQPGKLAQVAQIRSTDTGRLLKLAALGLAPGSWLRLQQRTPAYVLWVAETQLSIDQAVAQDIFVDAP